ncbi:acyl-CoA synthetase [Saccharomonospora sp. CUA-673]|uniref:AMP-binding protein n=1 Tax=Saccharomonospora sp. CUA-673 TaxID=1904969 RepID=UPI00095F5513|nr:AMP-binding protein [Saccharomonospora sp. CUA-673]OLT41650.1 acyl-CoA synthetase [Saccharomonospora sp. CUA-673]
MNPQLSDAFASGATYSDLIVEVFDRFCDKEAFVLGEQRMTFSEAAASMSRIQQVLAGLGVARRDGVGALSVNLPEVWLAQAATYLLGARYTGLHSMGSVDDHVAICDEAELKVLVVHPLFAAAGQQIVESSRTVKHLLVFGEADVGSNLFDLMAEHQPRALEPGPAAEEDIAWLQYTGGTTGKPKGAMLPHRAMVELTNATLASWQIPTAPRYLVAPPITHASVLPLFSTLARGGTAVLQQSFQPQAYLEAIEQEQINFTFMVPTMLYALLDHTKPDEYDVSSLETICYGAAPITPTRLAEALERFGPKFVQAYGQTECVGVTTSLLREEHDPHGRPDLLTSCGRPVIGTKVTILDDSDQPVPDGTPGELCVHSRAVMSGYWKMPELTAQTLRDGWLHTGDIAIRDAIGYLHIVDRKKDMIITGGFNVYPKEVEDAMASHPDVASVAVVGLPHPKWGEAVTAYVVSREGVTIDHEALKAHVREAKGPHQTPKDIIVIESLPTTAVGKIDKKQLRTIGSGVETPAEQGVSQ